jgi:lauroyl/myristoyl acyltransferase
MGSKLGSFIQTKENVEMVRKESWKFGREKFLELGLQYFKDHPEDVNQIIENLQAFNLDSSEQAVQQVLVETVAHYYEKLFVLTKQYEAYWIVTNRIEVADILEPLREAKQQGKGVFLGQSHFGVTYFLASVFMAHNFDLTTVGFFPGPVGEMLKANTQHFTEKYKTGKLGIINLAEPGVSPPLAMMQSLNNREMMMNVFDEKNSLCKPVDFLGRKMWGGTGMDQILGNYTDEQIQVATPFLIRTSEETFRLELELHQLSSPNIIQDFFNALEKRVKQYPAQWYFLQEVHENLEGL